MTGASIFFPEPAYIQSRELRGFKLDTQLLVKVVAAHMYRGNMKDSDGVKTSPYSCIYHSTEKEALLASHT